MNLRPVRAAMRIAGAAGPRRTGTLLTARHARAAQAAVPSPRELARLETHMADAGMRTARGENPEAYVSRDGTHLVFASNRQESTRGDTHSSIARWKP